MKNDLTLCPCGSQVPYSQCCQKYHQGLKAENALKLMRSRYSAYALKLPDYIIQTTHPASPHYIEEGKTWLKKISEFCQKSEFLGLEILDFHEHDHVATVVFTARIQQNGQDASFTEKSYFQKVKEKWLYRSGLIAEAKLPNQITNNQTRLLPLAYYGHPVLRKTAAPITEITPDVQRFVQEMIETMDACDGVGLAAPQVHQSVRLFVIRNPITDQDDQVEWGEIQVCINPILSEPSEETWKASEGCLSIPTIHADVTRPKEITIEYTDLNGKRIKERASGWKARVIMHENDHINGVLFIDRLDKATRKKLEPRLQQLHRRIHDGTEL